MRFLALTIVLAIAISTTSEAKKVRLGKDTTLECHGVNECKWKSPSNVEMDFGRETKTYKNYRYFILKFIIFSLDHVCLAKIPTLGGGPFNQ